MQSAMALVHSFPFIMQPEPLLAALAQRHGQTFTPPTASDAHRQDIKTAASWDMLVAYVVRVCSADHFEYVPLLSFHPSHNPLAYHTQPSSQSQTQNSTQAQNQTQAQRQTQPQSQDVAMSQGLALSSPDSLFVDINSEHAGILPAAITAHDTCHTLSVTSPTSHTLPQSDVSQSLSSPDFLFEAPSLSQLLGQKDAPQGPSSRRGFDHEILHPLGSHPWQGKIRGQPADDVVRDALKLRMTKLDE